MGLKYSVFTEPPEDFNATVEGAGCYCYFQDKILFVRRHPDKPQGNTWGIPGGKVEEAENPKMAVIREIHEEVGLDINDDSLEMIGRLYCRLPHIDYVFHLFKKGYNAIPEISLSLEEHVESKWVTIEEAFELPLIAGGREALIYFKKS